MNTISAFFSKSKNFVIAHKIISGILIIVLVGGGYYIAKARSAGATVTRYVVGTATTGTVVSSVSGSGQVSASNEVDVASKVSGNLISVNVTDGQEVTAGQLLAEVDPSTAKIDLENAELALENLTNPGSVSNLQTQDAVQSAQQALQNAQASLSTSYTSGLGSVAATFVDFPGIIQGLNTMFYTSTGTLNDTDTAYLTQVAQQYRNNAGENFDKAQLEYNKTLADYNMITTSSSTSTIESIINETLQTATDLTQAVKDAKNTVDYVKNTGTETTLKNIPTAQTNLNGWLSSLTGHVDSLGSAVTSIVNAKASIIDAQNSLNEKQASLSNVQDTSTNIDVRSQQLAVAQKQQAYDDYFIRAPFDGVVAKLDVENANTVNSGTAIATVITKNKIADISLNEVDISKVKVGQKATLTFDAVPDLTITGTVSQVDLVGTVTQGVVSYDVKITLDTDDSRVLSGMSASAVIATQVEQNVVTVPNSAIKTVGSSYYVQVVDPSTPVTTDTTQGDSLVTAPTEQQVQVGISDDNSTEITSGLSDGDKIVIKTITSSATAVKSTTATAASLLGGAGAGGRGGGGGFGGAARATTGR